MLAELRNLPPLFVVAADPRHKTETIKIGCTVSDDGNRLMFSALDGCNACYCVSLAGEELANLKEQSIEWTTFFADIERDFNAKTVKVVIDPHGGLVCAVKSNSPSGETKFLLSQTNDLENRMRLVNKMFDFYHVRLNRHEYEKQLADLAKSEAEIRRKLCTLEREKRECQDSITVSQEESALLSGQTDELEQELMEVTEKHRMECVISGEDPNAVDEDACVEPDFTQCIGRIALQPDKRDFDAGLLQLIKSRFVREEPCEQGTEAPSTAKYNNVIRPLIASQYEKQMKSLPDGERHVVMKALDRIDSWEYDVWTLQDFTNKGALFYTAYALFMRYDYFRKFNIDENIALNFFSQIEAGYHPNPYHNSMHGADVLHIIHYILTPAGLKERAQLSEEDALAALIAGMIHDYDHPGLNNNFHIKVQSYLATLYNDKSILETHHCAEVFELMKTERFNILECLTEVQRRDVRETIVEMVLSTDMGLHAKIFGTWKRRLGQDHDLHKRKDDQRLALSMAVKMADISNCGRPQHLYLKWGAKLSEEFFLQGDNERNRGDPVSPFMDRFAPSMAKSQIAFMNYIVIPMFESISEYLPNMHFSVDHCESNKSYWSSNDDSL